MTEPVPYQCFISYTRSDNDDHDCVVDRLKREIAGRFEADTGSKLEFFLDRESIGWGERWREKIADAIAGSILFMPIVTMRYFNSPTCRDELSAFHSAAIQRGVPDLILPVILAGSDQITPEHPDDLVRAVAELNWQPIFKEFEAGYESALWKTRIGTLVVGLRQALARAAKKLSDQAPSAQAPDPAAEDTERADERTQFAEMASDISDLRPIVEKIVTATSSRLADRDPAQMTTGQRTFLFGALADDLREPAETFRNRASAIEAKARRLDAELRALIAEMHLLTLQDIQRQLAALQGLSQKGIADAQQIFDQMDQLEKGLRMAALVSVKLRAALRPISTGLQSMSTTLTIVISWQSIELPRTLRRFMTVSNGKYSEVLRTGMPACGVTGSGERRRVDNGAGVSRRVRLCRRRVRRRSSWRPRAGGSRGTSRVVVQADHRLMAVRCRAVLPAFVRIQCRDRRGAQQTPSAARSRITPGVPHGFTMSIPGHVSGSRRAREDGSAGSCR